MVNLKTITLVKEFEGYGKRLADGRCIAYLDVYATKENPYYDHASGGLWTIGYGATGPGINRGTIWTQVQADTDLAERLEEIGKQIDAVLTVSITENQRGALISIAYNIGVHGIRGLIAKVNADPENAGKYFAAYKYATQNGQKVVLAGLVRRRTAEIELYEWEDKKQVAAMSPEIQAANTVQAATGASALSVAGMWQYLPQVKEFMHDNAGLLLLGAVGTVVGVSWLWRWHVQTAFNNGTYIPVGTKPVPTEADVEAFDADIAD